jgi:DNA-binding transcriptional LysR family regulator
MPTHPRDLEQHERIHFRDPLSGKPFEWELRRERTIAGKRQAEVVAVPAKGRLVVNDPASLLAACEAGCGIAQTLECYVRPYLDDGRLVQLLPAWSEERFPVYLYHHGGPLVPARVRTFIDFVLAHRDEFAAVHAPSRAARTRAGEASADDAMGMQDKTP